MNIKLSEWLDLDTIQICVRHASATLAAIIVFKVVGILLEIGIPDGTLKQALEIIDGFILVGLFLWLGYQMAVLLYKNRVRLPLFAGLGMT